MLTDLTIHELAARFRRGDATPTQAAREYLDRIAALDSKVKAYLTVTGEAALAGAAEADARFKSGTPRGPLDGVPLGLKDVFCTRGVRTTCGSKILEGFVPPYDATVVARLVRAGAGILGKLNMDEVGPLAKDVLDAALMLQAVAGHDPMDSTSAAVPVPDYAAELDRGVRGLRVGIPAEYFIEGLDAEVEAAVRAAVETLKGLGAKSESVSLPPTEYGLAADYLIAPAECSSNLARYDGVKYGLRVPGARDLIDMYSRTRGAGFGTEVKRRVMLGTYALSAGYYDAYYGKAQKVRTLVQRDFQKAFERVDVIVTPTTPSAAFTMGEKADPLSMYLNDVFTIPVNLAGLPGLSVPAGFTKSGLPVGLQIIGKAFDEATLLRTAKAYEAATTWRERKPGLAA